MSRGRVSNDALADRMAALIARGESQAEAFRTVRPTTRKLDSQAVCEQASRFCAKHKVQARVAELRKGMRLQDIYSTQAWLQDSIAQRDKALEAKNYNAAGGYQRQIGQAVGAIGSDTSTVILAHQLDDKAIIERLAAGDPNLAAALATKLGAKPPKPDQTKH